MVFNDRYQLSRVFLWISNNLRGLSDVFQKIKKKYMFDIVRLRTGGHVKPSSHFIPNQNSTSESLLIVLREQYNFISKLY